MINYINKIKLKFKFIFLSKWIFSLPKKRKILVVDGILNPFTNYFKANEINILYRRGEEINMVILFICLIRFEMTGLGYYKQYIKFTKPKIILSGIDVYPNFYLLSKLTKVKTAFFQRGRLSYMAGVLFNKSINSRNNKKKFHVDYMFVHNKTAAKLYNLFISGKTVCIGSLTNNIKKKIVKRKKKEVLYLSTYKPHNDYIPNVKGNKNITNKPAESFFKYDKFVIQTLSELSNKNNLNFTVLGRNAGKNLKKEKEYFNNVIKSKYNFVTRSKNKTSNEIMDEFEYVFTDFSTLGVDNLSKDGKTGFIFAKPDIYAWHTVRVGGLENFNLRGPFWTTSITNNKKEFTRVFNFVVKSNTNTWKKTRRKYAAKLMEYDPGNKKFLKIIKKAIN